MKNLMRHKRFGFSWRWFWHAIGLWPCRQPWPRCRGRPLRCLDPQKKRKSGRCPATFGPIITDTAIPIDKGKFAVQPTFGMSFATNSLTQSWRRVSAGGDFKSFGMDYKFTYGLCNNLEVFMVVPFANNWAGSCQGTGTEQ